MAIVFFLLLLEFPVSMRLFLIELVIDVLDELTSPEKVDLFLAEVDVDFLKVGLSFEVDSNRLLFGVFRIITILTNIYLINNSIKHLIIGCKTTNQLLRGLKY